MTASRKNEKSNCCLHVTNKQKMFSIAKPLEPLRFKGFVVETTELEADF